MSSDESTRVEDWSESANNLIAVSPSRCEIPFEMTSAELFRKYGPGLALRLAQEYPDPKQALAALCGAWKENLTI